MRLGGFLLPKRFSLAVWRKGVPHPLLAGHKVSVSSASPSSAWPPEISEVDKIIITRSSAPCPNSFTCSLPPAKDSHGFSLVNRVSPPIAFPIPHSLRAFTSSWSCFAMRPAFLASLVHFHVLWSQSNSLSRDPATVQLGNGG